MDRSESFAKPCAIYRFIEAIYRSCVIYDNVVWLIDWVII